MRMSHDAIVARALAAEAAGFDGVALMDHLAPPGLTTGEMFDAITTATVVLGATTRLRVTHLVLCNQFRHPAVLAKEVVGLDHLSAGRFELGIGWGSVADELHRFGIGDDDAASRSARLGESLEIVRRLVTGEVVDHDGRFFRLEGAQQRPAALGGGVPVMVGGAGPRLTMPLVRAYADWWNLPSYGADRYDELRPLAGDARVSVQLPVGLAAGPGDLDAVTEVARRRFGGWGGLVTGTPDQVADALAAYTARGVERFFLQLSDFGTDETLQRFAAEVRPRI
jgi:alkanesulfonate monooxygenase SsuD/methylene tetrahydromethanopterin reductase-like flavin-dependent oxidoreductase (luciferase family)